MLDAQGITGILDWEFAGWSDPFEDLGWFCAKCWRFGANDLEAGGIGERRDFYAGYEAASGRKVDADAVRYWEIFACIARWATIAIQQVNRHLSGAESNLDVGAHRRDRTGARIRGANCHARRSLMRQPPGAAELLKVASEVMRRVLLPTVPEERRYEALMVLRAMAIAEREIERGDDTDRESREEFEMVLPRSMRGGSLEVLAMHLAARIREGYYDDLEEEREAVRLTILDSIRRRLAETNPRYLADGE